MVEIKENPLAVKSGDIFINKSAPVSCSTALWRELAEAALEVLSFMLPAPFVEVQDEEKYKEVSERLKIAIKKMKP